MFASIAKIGLLSTLFITLAAGSPPCAAAQEETSDKDAIEALGTAVIVGKDVAKAREQAIDNALTAAIARIVARKVPQELLIQQFKELNLKIFNQTDQYVDSYKVLTEALGGERYRVMVQASVSAPRIHEELAALNLLNQPTQLPRVLILLSGSKPAGAGDPNAPSPDGPINDQTVRALIAKEITAQEMEVIGPEQLAQTPQSQNSPQTAVLTDEKALEIGRQVLADVVIVGVYGALLTPNTMGTDVRSFKGSVNLRALRTDVGVEIASVDQSNVTVSDDATTGRQKAITNASAMAGKRLAAKIVSAWTANSAQTNVQTARIVEIVVEGAGSLSNFVMFRRVLSELPGVNDIQIKEMKADEARISVRFQGDGKQLADSLMMKSYETFGIDIFEVGPEIIKVELIPG